ncbi:MAG: RNA polymerase subunit sigma, partial [Actinobacteria bacterium]|nr:RNA polymerase subunit sigma [Actinomycetota bacterium]
PPPGTPGSRVSLSLTGLTGPRSCRLVALRGDGATQVLATWRVPASGFGTSGQPDPFTLAVTAAVPVADLTGLRVESVDAAGGSSVLVRLRL